MSSVGTNVFVSYSHADASLVAPVVKLLRVNKSLVFQDIDGIQPGKRWRSEIANALFESHLVVVFWCDHASRSDEVSKEWQTAIEHQKDLLPLLLDATPLPPQLSEFQWIDFRATVGANHSAIDSPDGVSRAAPSPPSAAPLIRWVSLTGLAATLVIAVGLGLYTFNAPQAPLPTQTPELPEPTPVPLPAPAVSFDFISILTLLVVVFVITACLVWLLRRRSKRRISTAAAKRQGEVERRIASELEAEILRRIAFRREEGA